MNEENIDFGDHSLLRNPNPNDKLEPFGEEAEKMGTHQWRNAVDHGVARC